MQNSSRRYPIARVDRETEADAPVRVEVSCIFGNVVKNMSLSLVDIEDGCFKVNRGPKVVVVGQFVWVDKDVGRESVESMKRTVEGERRKRETRNKGGMKAGCRSQVTHPHMFPAVIRRWSTTATKPAKFGQPVFASHPHLSQSALFLDQHILIGSPSQKR